MRCKFFLIFCASLWLSCGSALNLPGVPSAFTDNDDVLSAVSVEIAHKFAKEYLEYMKTGVESPVFSQISLQLATSHTEKDIFTKNVEELGAADQFFMCTTCRATVNVLGSTFREPEGELHGPGAEKKSKKIMLDICARLKISTQDVCEGLFEIYWPTLEYIIQNSEADSRSLCGTLPIKFCKVKQEKFNFSLKIDSSGPTVTAHKKDIPKKSSTDLKILQLTDLHYDRAYVPDSLAECHEPMCCQRTPVGGVEQSKRAGYWSDYRSCDSPLHMISNAFDHIKATHTQIDYIYQTGDIIPHNYWETSKKGNMESIRTIDELIAEKFPGVAVYSSVGNHDSHPMGVFGATDTPDELNIKWLYEHLWTLWSKWLPADSKETVLKGGYYTVAPKKGFRIISLNNNDCYLLNFWIYHDGSVVIEQLQWLHDTLLAAEKAGEYVHILAHIPSGNVECWTVWAREYNRIIERFSHIIGGIFNGHTHLNEFYVHYTKKRHAFAVTWNGGSLGAYANKNPNYVVYEVEPKSQQVVDYETWIFDLEEANANGADVKPNWNKEYSLSEFTEDLSPAGLDALLEEMARYPELLRKFWRYRVTMAAPRLAAGCNNKCLLSTICRLVTTTYDEKTRCQELQSKLEANMPEETTESPIPTANPTSTEDPNDGSAAIAAMQFTTIVSLCLLVKYFL